MAASIYENIPEISDRASHSMRNRETNPVESLCFPDVRAEPHPVCTTQAERSPDSIRRGCTASVFLRVSEYFCGVHLDFPPWATSNTGGSHPRHLPDLLRTHSHSG